MGMFPAISLFIIAIAAMLSFLLLEPEINSSLGIPLIVFFSALIIVFSWVGLFKKSIVTYAIFSTLIQTSYFALDVASALAAEKSIWFSFVHLFNFFYTPL